MFLHISLFLTFFYYFRCVFLLTRELNPLMLIDITGMFEIFVYNHHFYYSNSFSSWWFCFSKVFLWYLGTFAFLVLVVTFTHSCVYLCIFERPKSLFCLLRLLLCGVSILNGIQNSHLLFTIGNDLILFFLCLLTHLHITIVPISPPLF